MCITCIGPILNIFGQLGYHVVTDLSIVTLQDSYVQEALPLQAPLGTSLISLPLLGLKLVLLPFLHSGILHSPPMIWGICWV